MRRSFIPLAAALAVGLAACQEAGAPSPAAEELADGFATLPLGYGEVHSTFGSDEDSGTRPWSPDFVGDRGFDGDRDMMCGGVRGFFHFGLNFGLRFGFFRGILPDNCAYDPASQRVLCDAVTRNGLTIVRSAAFTDVDGEPQPGFDPRTTNTVNVRVDVSGTFTRRDDHTTEVEHHSDRTVSGLAPGSTELLIDGTSAGTETTTGANRKGDFVAVRTIGDTIQGVMLPRAVTGRLYPTAGTIIRSLQVTVTYAGEPPRTWSRREVVTFDGSNIATIVITKNGVTKTCTLDLLTGQLSCSD